MPGSRALSVEKRFEPRVEVSETHLEVSQALPASYEEEKYR